MAGCSILGIAVWIGGQGLSAARESRWIAAERDGPAAILDLGVSATNLTLAERQGFANALANSIFPPQHERAASELGLALRGDPLSSDLWHRLAKEDILLGRPDLARACLERSDLLDPRYPEQRFDAINLWTLLGEPERAAHIARRIADLGGAYREQAAQHLLESGLAPQAIFSGLGGPRLPASEQLRIMTTLLADPPDDGRAEAAELFASANLDGLEGIGELSAAAKLAASRSVYPAAVEFWRKARPGLEMVDALVPADNLRLRTTPFLEPFYLGWQPPEASVEPTLRWKNRDVDSIYHPDYLRLEFFQGRTKRGHTWIFYRFLIPAAVRIQLRVPVRLIPAERSDCSLVLLENGKEIASASASTIDGDWQFLEVPLPSSSEPRVIELAIRRVERMAGQPASVKAEVRIGGIDLTAHSEGARR